MDMLHIPVNTNAGTHLNDLAAPNTTVNHT